MSATITAQTLTTFLAIWGAFLSTFTMGWMVYRDLMQRGRLRVNCYVGHIFGDPTISSDTKLLMWTVTNIGREPVVLTNVGGSFGKKAFVVNTRDPLPKTLAPGEYFIGHSNDFSVLTPELKYLCAHDSLNRTFKAPRRAVRKMVRKYGTFQRLEMS